MSPFWLVVLAIVSFVVSVWAARRDGFEAGRRAGRAEVAREQGWMR